MFLSAKSKGFVLDQGEQTTALTRVSSLTPPLVIEAIREFSTDDQPALIAALSELAPGRKSGSYLFAKCGVNPEGGFIRRATLDTKRVKEEGYMLELVNSQFRLDVEVNNIAIINAGDGLGFDANKPNVAKDVLFCGMPKTTIDRLQENILAQGVFPESLELSSLGALAALVDYIRFTESAKPCLVLEIGAQATQSFIVGPKGVEAVRPISVGLESMVPIVQKELGLKDEESARKLFFSNTFDFTGMGSALCKRLLKELQSSMGFYEVQTGQSISQLICTVLPSKLEWLESVVATQLGLVVLIPDMKPWLSARGITFAADVDMAGFDARKLPTLGLLLEYTTQSSNVSQA
jgi:hypothetical protein